jgi:hypothetical protein
VPVLHEPYSPELALADFWLFLCIKMETVNWGLGDGRMNFEKYSSDFFRQFRLKNEKRVLATDLSMCHGPSHMMDLITQSEYRQRSFSFWFQFREPTAKIFRAPCNRKV